MSFTRQLKVLIWKNAVLKWRFISVLLIEIVFPVVIIIALAGIKKAAAPTEISNSFPATYYQTQSFDDMFAYAPCNGQNLVWMCANPSCDFVPPSDFTGVGCKSQRIAIAPLDSANAGATTAALQFQTWMSAKYPLSSNYSTFEYFSSQHSFLNVIDNPNYALDPNTPIYSTAVIFTSGYPDWKFNLRLNQSYSMYGSSYDAPSLTDPNVDVSVLYNSQSPSATNFPYNQAYINTGIFPLMDAVNSFVATKTCQTVGKCTNTEEITLTMAGSADFPNIETTVNQFWNFIGSLFSILIIIAVLYPLANVISSLVQEKETKLREGMLMMALRGDTLWVSWIIHFLFLFVPLAILLTLVGSMLFSYSQGIYIFFYFMTFFLSSVSYCFLASMFFSKSRTAAIAGILFFFAGYFIYIGMQFAQMSRSSIMAACLHPAAAFTFGSAAIAEWEGANIGISQFTWNKSNKYDITFQDTLNMMFIDFIYMGVLAWYVNQIWPSEFGTHKPWYFIFLPSYWLACFKSCLCCITGSGSGKNNYSQLKKVMDSHGTNSNIEPVPESLLSQIDGNKCVDIRGLYKEFNTSSGPKVAVDHLTLTMFSGQITALLGHNGAGKSTAISILTGLIPADGGDAIIEGKSINENMDEIRRTLGVCPQHDVLYPDLTVEEHLGMFASFKGIPSNQVKEEVDKMIAAVGLTEKRRAFAKQLSGGQKRKLSVGIAFIGGSRIVFLDEPTSGMDPYSRRFTWNVIRQHREGRVIILTTHFMDEADLLGDRVAIMGDGKLLCCGSSLYLKSLFGVGYNMTIEKNDAVNFNSDRIHTFITNKIPDAKVLTDVGAEMTFQLPLTSSHLFQGIFSNLDDNLDSYGIRSYGMSVTTLEEVFIKVQHSTHTQAVADAARKGSNGEVLSTTNIHVDAKNGVDVESRAFQPVAFKSIDDSDQVAYFIRHFQAMILKRYYYFLRDTKTWILQFAIPVIFVLVGMLVMKYTNFLPTTGSKTLTHSLYNSDINNDYLPFLINNGSTTFCEPLDFNSNTEVVPVGNCAVSSYDQSVFMSQIPDASNYPILSTPDISSIANMSSAIFNHRKNYEASVFGSVSFLNTSYNSVSKVPESLEYVVHANYSALHASPLYSMLVATGVVESIDSSSSIQATLNSLPLTTRQQSIYSSYNAGLIVTFILLAIPSIPAAWIAYVVREREVKAKHVQIVSGVTIPAYWFSTWVWDNLSYQLTMWCIIILIAGFPDTWTLSSRTSGAMGVTIGLFIMFGLSMTGLTYLFSFLFKTPSGALLVTLVAMFITGEILVIVGFVLRAIPSTSAVFNNHIRFLFAMFPAYAFGEGLYNLTNIQLWSILELDGGKMYSPLDWEIAGADLMMLGWQSVVYIGLVIVWEYVSAFPSFQALFVSPSNLPPPDSALRDEDVLTEESRCAVGGNDTTLREKSVILLKDLRKMYGDGKYAVKGVSLAIPRGECFGLLGINGAGKSTLLSMLSGEVQPTTGEAWLAGHSLLTDIHKCRREIGFCPQFDALFELLTGREHLELYARIKGILESDIEKVVNAKIAEMGLTEYADRAAGTYSGGNKRKLSVAIAMIGEPNIVFLDEPSTGMDVVAKRFMWSIITDIVTKREACSVILVSHSMEECEALCTRIGIMVGGVMRCLGSSQRLRTKYGRGFQVEIGFMVPDQKSITEKSAEILTSLSINIPADSSPDDYHVNMTQIHQAITNAGKVAWIEDLSESSSGGEIFEEAKRGDITLKQLSSWWILEDHFDHLKKFLVEAFHEFSVRERQASKVRIEIPAAGHRLSDMFGAIEKYKESLGIQDYSISQTSLEQIFNYFASQQEEEKGKISGMTTGATSPRNKN